MLVLTRKATEEITIGTDVRVIVLGIQGNRVRLGFVAPDDVEIHRAELDLSEPVLGSRLRIPQLVTEK